MENMNVVISSKRDLHNDIERGSGMKLNLDNVQVCGANKTVENDSNPNYCKDKIMTPTQR